MSICFSHLSADRILTRLAAEGVVAVPVSSAVVREFEFDFRMARDVLADLGVSRDEVELIGPLAYVGPPRAGECGHVWSGRLPEGAILKLDEGVYTSSPSFTLLQLAYGSHLIEYCQLLGRYMGSRKVKAAVGGLAREVEVGPLVSEDELRRFIKGTSHAHGAKLVLEALRYTCAGSASPQETNLQLALTLPSSHHGFMLKKPVMNYKVDLEGHDRLLFDRECCFIDLCWPEKSFGLEFQGEFHNEQIAEDYDRFYVLQQKGFTVWYLAYEQLKSAPHMQVIAREVARRTGKRIERAPWPTEKELQVLLDALTNQAGGLEVEPVPMRRRRR